MDTLEQQAGRVNTTTDATPRAERLLTVLSFFMFVTAISVAYTPFLGAGVIIGVLIARLHYRR
jgi:hypothetical protein